MDYNLPVFTQPISSIVIKLEESPWTEKTNTTKSEHKVIDGDNLTKVAEQYSTTVQRLFDANPHIEHPDNINVEEVLAIPAVTDVLVHRPFPTPPQPQTTTTRAVRSSGGGYIAGQCTAYAWSRRPDLPSNLGSANTWYARAQAQGYFVGSVPRAKAIAQATTGYMHVAYVERVNSDGTIFISEQNYKGEFIVSTRTAPASAFVYIY